jgi:hypothetical protein
MPANWTTPKTMADQDPTLYGDWNTYLRDNLLYLYDQQTKKGGILIASTTVAAAVSYSFSSIPATFTHLRLRGYQLYTVTAAAQLRFRFNADTGANYDYGSWGRTYASGTLNDGATGATSILTGSAVSLTTTQANGMVFEADIFDYTSSTYQKHMLGKFGALGANGGFGGVWRAAVAAINAIEIATSTGNNFWGKLELYGFG